ncbi:MAG: PepSY-associated TM helix domain-containing protein, partial [Pseudomonadota bacterium]
MSSARPSSTGKQGDQKKTTFRRLMFKLHSWLGLKLCVLMAFVSLTGALATLAQEIDWLLNPEMRVTAPDSVERLSWGEQLDAALTAGVAGEVATVIQRHDPWFATEIQVITPWAERVRLWVDPYTGNYIGATSWFNVQRFLRQTHRHLMMPVQIGVPIVSSLGVVLLLAIATGLVVYKKFWRGWGKLPRWNLSSRVWLGDLHRLLGLWTLWFILIIALTSVWYLVESLGARAPALPRPTIPSTAELGRASGAQLDQAIAAARAARPSLNPRVVRFPTERFPAFVIQGQDQTLLVRDRANAVWTDLGGKQLGSYEGESLGLHQRIGEAADPLHFGTWGGEGWMGLIVRIAWFVLGMILFGMSLTGVVIYGARTV